MLTLLPYSDADLDPMIALFRRAVRAVPLDHYTPEQTHAWAPDQIDSAAWIARNQGRLVIISWWNGSMAGFADLEPNGHIDRLFVDPDFQGRGIGGALLKQIEDAAQSHGLASLTTEASITARPVFERCGFLVETEQIISLRGQSFRNFQMRKEINGLG